MKYISYTIKPKMRILANEYKLNRTCGNLYQPLQVGDKENKQFRGEVGNVNNFDTDCSQFAKNIIQKHYTTERDEDYINECGD